MLTANIRPILIAILLHFGQTLRPLPAAHRARRDLNIVRGISRAQGDSLLDRLLLLDARDLRHRLELVLLLSICLRLPNMFIQMRVILVSCGGIVPKKLDYKIT